MGEPVKCFMLEPVSPERVRQKLRRYSRDGRWDETQKRAVYDNPCPLNGYYHNAETQIEDADPIYRTDDEGGRILINGSRQDAIEPYINDPRWPERCACGYVFTESDHRQLFCELLYRRADTGDEMTLRGAPAGAMWFAEWVDRFFKPQLAHSLIVKLPDGTDWQIDSMANNCTMRDDFKQERHHCWVIDGAPDVTPPNITVGKGGPTCGAGAGSIQSPRYHGFLRGGYLVEA